MLQKIEIARKAYQISYILIRFAQNIVPESQFRKSIYDLAISLVVEVNQKNTEKAVETLTTLQWLFRLAADSGLMSLSDAEVIIEDCYSLTLEINKGEVSDQAIWLSDSPFSEFIKEASKLKGISNKVLNDKEEAKESATPIPIKEESNAKTSSQEPIYSRVEAPARSSSSTRERQASILEFIRQQTAKSEIAVCRLKDLQTAFTDVSERTLRYDLQKLMDEGKVERLGGGPTSAYRLIKKPLLPPVTS